MRLGADGSEVLGEQRFGAAADYTEHVVTVTVPDGVHEVTMYAGFVAPGFDTWIQLDDVSVSQGGP